MDGHLLEVVKLNVSGERSTRRGKQRRGTQEGPGDTSTDRDSGDFCFLRVNFMCCYFLK